MSAQESTASFAAAEQARADARLDVAQAADAQAAAISNLAQHAADKALIAEVAGLRVAPDADPEAMLLANMAAAETSTTTPPLSAAGGAWRSRPGRRRSRRSRGRVQQSRRIGHVQNLDALRSVRERKLPTEDEPEPGIRIRDNDQLTDMSGLGGLPAADCGQRAARPLDGLTASRALAATAATMP